MRYGYGRLGIALYSLAANAAFLDPCICFGPEPGLSASSPPEKKDQLLAPNKIDEAGTFFRSCRISVVRHESN